MTLALVLFPNFSFVSSSYFPSLIWYFCLYQQLPFPSVCCQQSPFSSQSFHNSLYAAVSSVPLFLSSFPPISSGRLRYLRANVLPFSPHPHPHDHINPLDVIEIVDHLARYHINPLDVIEIVDHLARYHINPLDVIEIVDHLARYHINPLDVIEIVDYLARYHINPLDVIEIVDHLARYHIYTLDVIEIVDHLA